MRLLFAFFSALSAIVTVIEAVKDLKELFNKKKLFRSLCRFVLFLSACIFLTCSYCLDDSSEKENHTGGIKAENQQNIV